MAQVGQHHDLSQQDIPRLFRLEELKGLNLYESSVEEVQQCLLEGHFTSVDYVDFCLRRIHIVNPYLECIIEVNPDALKIAAGLDGERRQVGQFFELYRCETRAMTREPLSRVDSKKGANSETFGRVKLEAYYMAYQYSSKITWPQRTKCKQRPVHGRY